jgi:hypothetical protein
MSALFDFERLTNDDYVKQSLLLASLVPRLSPMAPIGESLGTRLVACQQGEVKVKQVLPQRLGSQEDRSCHLDQPDPEKLQ